MSRFALLWILAANVIRGQLIGDCVGCRRPAPPKCCPPTCPRCLPINKRHRPDLFDDARSDSLPVSITQPKRRFKSGGKRKSLKNLVGGAPGRQRKLLDESDFYRIDDWAVPKEECSGPDCACANCVCCFTETLLFSETTTCTATQTSTIFATSTFTSTFVQSTFLTRTNNIKFLVTNTLEFVSTISHSVSGTDTISLTFSGRTTFVSFSSLYLDISTMLGAVGTVFSELSVGPTVTVATGTTTTTSRVAVSLYDPFTVFVTSVQPTAFNTSLVTIPLYKCARPVTFTVNGTLAVTGTASPVTIRSTPVETYIDATTRITKITTENTLTFSRCTGIETIKWTPIRTIVAETVRPSVCPADVPGCPVCVVVPH